MRIWYNKKIILFAFILVVAHIYNLAGLAQVDNFIVNGLVKDSETNQIMEFATIEVRTERDSLYHSLISDSEGSFYVHVPNGSYKFFIHYMGYVSAECQVVVQNEDVYLGNIFVVKDALHIEEIEIKGSNYRQKIDREVHVVTKEMKQGVSSVKTLLNKVKSVYYDPVSNKINVDNDSKVLLLVDGLEKDQEYVKNLLPERVLRLEIFKDPGGKYVSKGYSSVINIILKKDYTGYDLNIDERALLDLDNPTSQNILARNNFYTYLNYTNKKLNVYSSYAHDRTAFNLSQVEKKSLDNIELTKTPLTNSDPNLLIKDNTHQVSLGSDYIVNSAHLISLENAISVAPRGINNYSESYLLSQINNQDITNNVSQSLDANNSINFTTQLTYLYNKKKNEVSASFGYNYYDYNRENRYFLSNELLYNQTNNNRKDYLILDIEYKHTFSDKIQGELGYSGTRNKTDIQSTYNGLSLGESNQFLFRNLGYSYVTYAPSDKLTTKAGLGIEGSHNTSSDWNYNFVSYYPLLNILYKPHSNTSFTLKYRSISDYPKIYQLNPYPTRLDVISAEIGNPTLGPSNMQKISLNAGLFDGLIDIQPYYTFNKSHIDRTGDINDDVFLFTYVNIDDFKQLGCEFAFEFKFFKTLYWNTSVNFYRAESRYLSMENELNDWLANSSLLYYNPKHESIIALLLKKENVKNISPYGYYTDNNDYLALYFDQPFFDGLFNLSLLYTLPVNFGFNYYQEEKFQSEHYSEYNKTDISLISNLLMVNITFRFNNKRYDKEIEKKYLWEDEPKQRSISL